MAAFEVLSLDPAVPQIRAPGASDTYTFPRAVELPLGTANGVLYLNGSKVVTSGSVLTWDAATGKLDVDTNGNTGHLRLNAFGNEVGKIRTPFSGAAYNIMQYDVISGGNHQWAINLSEQMRLNSTGLGIGVSPSYKLDVNGDTNISAASSYRLATAPIISLSGGVINIGDAGGSLRLSGTSSVLFNTASTLRATLDSSGNLGLGVTPSNWVAYKAIQFGPIGAVSSVTGATIVGNNWFYDGASKYITTATATIYEQGAGTHKWYTAPSGTAGNAISFTQAMTLDASGNLLVGKTSPTYSASSRSVFEINNTDSSIIALQYGGANGYYLQANSTAAYLWNSANTPWIVATNNTERARIPAAGGMVVGTAALATNATGGFLYVPTCAGQPTGTPTTQTGTAPIVVDTTNNKLYFYSGGAWRDAGP